MTIYECLGLETQLINSSIPKELICENIGDEELMREARFVFGDINRVSLRASLNRNEHYLQVIEVDLNSANNIQRISFLIQKAIKYQILFVFSYRERYLLLFRNFKLTESSENVTSPHSHYCSCWMYEECLHEDYLVFYEANRIDNYEEDEEYYCSPKYLTSYKDYGYFSDLLDNVIFLNYAVLEGEMVCIRFVLDWLNTHISGRYMDHVDVFRRIRLFKNYQMLGNNLFIEKSTVENVIETMAGGKYPLRLGHTGRRPENYFKGITKVASYDDTHDITSYMLYGRADMFDSEFDYYDIEDNVPEEVKKYYHPQIYNPYSEDKYRDVRHEVFSIKHQKTSANKETIHVKTSDQEQEPYRNADDCLEFVIEELELSVRAYYGLKRNDIHTVEQLCELSREELEAFPQLNEKSIHEIEEKLDELGLTLKESTETINDTGYSDIDELISQVHALKEQLINSYIESFVSSYGDELGYSEVYIRFYAYISLEFIDEAFEYLCNAVENGYRGNYYIISMYYSVGYEGKGGGEYDKAYIWLKRFYEDYMAGNIHEEGPLDFDLATEEFNLGLLSFMYKDSLSSEEEGVEYWKRSVEHSDKYTDNLSKIAVGMLGVNMNIHGTEMPVNCNMKVAIDAIKQDAKLGNIKANRVLRHINRDGYNINDPEEFLVQLNNNENMYMLACCSVYEYGVSYDEETEKDIFSTVFGDSFSYEAYIRRHTNDVDEETVSEGDCSITILQTNEFGIRVHGVEFDYMREVLNINFDMWSYHNTKVTFWGHNILVNGIKIKPYSIMGELNEDRVSGDMKIEISDIKGIDYSNIKEICLSVLIDDDYAVNICRSSEIKISCDTLWETASIEIISDCEVYK